MGQKDLQRQHLDIFFNLSLDLLAIANTDGYLEQVNPAFTEHLGWTEEELTTKPFFDFIHPEDIQSTQNELECLKQGFVTLKFRNRYRTKNSEYIWLEWSARPTKEGKLYCVARNMTELQQLSDSKMEFVSYAAHQLRTPLSSIRWSAELLLSEQPGPLTKKQLLFIKNIDDTNSQMISLVNDFLNVSRIELDTFQVKKEKLNIVPIIEKVIQETSPSLQEKKIEMEFFVDQGPPDIQSDKKMLSIVFQNIIANAVKYTPEKGKITIKVELGEEDIMISIQDTGFGIPQDQQHRIFEKLFRADNAVKKESEGNGLGLYLVKSILKKLGGKVWFLSEEQKGTTFFITLPAQE